MCGRAKSETNHWLVAITRQGMGGIMFVPAEAVETPRREGYTYQDICGQECAHKRLSQYLTEFDQIDFNRKDSLNDN